jgi:hypothetical protein
LADAWEPFSERHTKQGSLWFLKRAYLAQQHMGNLVDEPGGSMPVPNPNQIIGGWET